MAANVELNSAQDTGHIKQETMKEEDNMVGSSEEEQSEEEFSEDEKPLCNENPSSTGIEGQFFGRFMTPMLAKMETSAKRNTDMLDELQREMDQERLERFRKQASTHIPDEIKEFGIEMKDIIELLENLIVFENFDENEDDAKLVKARLKDMDATSEVAITSHTISAYISTLEPSHLKHLVNRIVSNVTKWLCALFRMDNSSAYCNEDDKECLVKICRLAIHKKYPKYATDGYEALYPRPPVIYISAASRSGLGQYLCSQLGLPSSCLVTVPLYKNTHRMDVEALSRLVDEDLAASKTPVMVVAYAGTPVVGHVDDISILKPYCQKQDLWLHIEGNNVALLTYFSMPTNVKPIQNADSIAINLGGWTGVPSLPYVVLYKTPEEAAHARLAGLTTYSPKYKLNYLPLWIVLQNMGHYGVFEKIKYAVELAKSVHEKVNTYGTLRNVTLFEIENPTVVFRYVRPDENPDLLEKQEKKGKGDNDEGLEAEEDIEKLFQRNHYFDALNFWLCETLKRDCPKVHIAAVEIGNEGVCIRFAPMESIHDYDTTQEEMNTFLSCLEKQLSILDATVSHRDRFQEIVKAQDNIRLVTLTNWAGLGALQYIPQSQVDNLSNLTELGQSEINKINYELVQQLKSADTAFSLGQTSDRLFCVRFGLVTQDTDLEELIGLVYTTGKEVEESASFLESMAEQIRIGIEKAQEDLVKENQDKIAQEGALRQLPMIGSFMNWWSPPPKENTKGRAFNLASGTIRSTEETYKYKMQVQEEAEQALASPSTKQRHGSYKANLKPLSSQTSSTHENENLLQSEQVENDHNNQETEDLK